MYSYTTYPKKTTRPDAAYAFVATSAATATLRRYKTSSDVATSSFPGIGARNLAFRPARTARRTFPSCVATPQADGVPQPHRPSSVHSDVERSIADNATNASHLASAAAQSIESLVSAPSESQTTTIGHEALVPADVSTKEDMEKAEIIRQVDKEDRALLLKMAAPSYIAQAMDPIAAMVDLYWIGRVGDLPLAGASVAAAIFNSVLMLFQPFAFTANAVVARAMAKKDPQERATATARATASSLKLSLYMGIAAALPIIAFAPQLVRMMGASSAVVGDAVGYLRTRTLGMPLLVMFYALSGVFRGFADLSRPLYASICGNIANLILDPVLMFGFLALGTVGAGLATSTASVVTVGYLIVYLLRKKIIPWSLSPKSLQVPRQDVKAIYGPLVALSSKRVLEYGLLALSCSRAARIGPAASAALEIARQVWWTVGVLWWPLCVAVAAVISKVVAESSDTARIRRIAAYSVLLTAVVGLIGGVGTAMLSGALPKLFVTEPSFVSAAAESLFKMAPLLAISSVMDTLDAVLIAGGDGIFNTTTTAIAVLACVRYLLLPIEGITVAGIWNALLVCYVLRLVMNIVRFLYVHRKSKA